MDDKNKKSDNEDPGSGETKDDKDAKGELEENPEIVVGKTIIEKAKSAKAEDKKGEAFNLYRQGIQHLLRGIKDPGLGNKQRKKLKQQCSEHLEEAEILQQEISDVKLEDKESVDENIYLEKTLNGIIDAERRDLTLEDVCGCQDVKEKLMEYIILPIKFPQLFHGKRTWRGILLYGAPGTGKTMLGRALAGENPDICFMRVTASDLMSKWLGDAEMIVQHLFEKAKKKKPACILFIDDFEQLFNEPETEHDWLLKLRCELLMQLDHLNDVLLVVGAQEPWKIPQQTFLRRLDRRVLVPMPDLAARKDIFMKNIKALKHSIKEEDCNMFAEKTEGYTGADICCIVQDASMEPVRKLDSATHFKKVRGQSLTDPDAVIDDLLTPCSPDDSEAIKMTWMEIPENKLYEPEVTTADIMKSLSKSKPSISQEYLQKIQDFTEQYVG